MLLKRQRQVASTLITSKCSLVLPVSPSIGEGVARRIRRAVTNLYRRGESDVMAACGKWLTYVAAVAGINYDRRENNAISNICGDNALPLKLVSSGRAALAAVR